MDAGSLLAVLFVPKRPRSPYVGRMIRQGGLGHPWGVDAFYGAVFGSCAGAGGDPGRDATFPSAGPAESAVIAEFAESAEAFPVRTPRTNPSS